MRKQREKIFFTQRSSMARALFYLNTVFWLLLSVNTLAAMIVDDNSGFTVGLTAFFLLVNVLAMFLGGRLLGQAEKWTYVFALIVALLNAALSFTGVPDLLYTTALVIDVLILLALFSLRNIYFN